MKAYVDVNTRERRCARKNSSSGSPSKGDHKRQRILMKVKIAQPGEKSPYSQSFHDIGEVNPLWGRAPVMKRCWGRGPRNTEDWLANHRKDQDVERGNLDKRNHAKAPLLHSSSPIITRNMSQPFLFVIVSAVQQ